MSLDRMIRIAIILGAALVPAGVHAQIRRDEATWANAFDALVARTPDVIASLRKQQQQRQKSPAIVAAEQEAATIAQSLQVSDRAPSLSAANVSTTVEKAEAAIKTDIKGADAGVSINPFALAGKATDPVQLILTAAALKDGVTRFQPAITWQLDRPAELDLPECKALTAAEIAAFKSTANRFKPAYLHACAMIGEVDISGMDTTLTRQVAAARAACGLPSGEPAPASLGDATRILARVLELLDQDHRDITRHVDLRALASELHEFRQPPIDCVTESTITDAIVRASWTTPRLRFGLSLRADLFPRKFGFHPESTDPRDLRRSDSEVRLEFSRGRDRFEFSAGLGYGAGCSSPSAPLVSYWSPALSVAWTVGSLGDKPLYDDGRLNVVNGALQPRLVIGLDASLQYATDPPPGQVVNVQKANVTPYADFRFTDKLTVRVGIPIAAALETRKGDMNAGGKDKMDRQWTVPAFVATILKL